MCFSKLFPLLICYLSKVSNNSEHLELIRRNSQVGIEDAELEATHRKEFKDWFAKKVNPKP